LTTYRVNSLIVVAKRENKLDFRSKRSASEFGAAGLSSKRIRNMARGKSPNE
jgi:hypothetical protein